jgi:hypothetical protein
MRFSQSRVQLNCEGLAGVSEEANTQEVVEVIVPTSDAGSSCPFPDVMLRLQLRRKSPITQDLRPQAAEGNLSHTGLRSTRCCLFWL